jgi:protein-S-isoprenylcysteine O-methyltransferase Ste14
MIKAIQCLWLALGVYWFLTAMRSKRVRRRENRVATWLRIGLLVAAFEFLFSHWGRIGFLGRRFVPDVPAVAMAGVALTALGVGLAFWARYTLGGNWSGAVTLKEGHELIRTGPYASIRHPIYTGIQLGLAGTMLAVGQWRGVVAFAAIVVAQYFKARKEEAWLAGEFGAVFEEHRSRTGMFFPRFSRSKVAG